MSVRNPLLRLPVPIKRFGPLVTDFDGEAKPGDTFDQLNLSAQGFSLVPRPGYVNVLATPISGTQPFQCFGLGYVTNDVGASEFISVENHNGTINAWSIHKDTFVRSMITSSVLNSGNWIISHFFENAYLINPSGTKTVARHKIGDLTSLTYLQDSAYVNPDDPLITATPRALGSRGWDAGDAWTYTSTNGIAGGATFTPASGTVTVAATDNDNGVQHRTQFQVVLTASVDYTNTDYIAIPVLASNIFDQFEITNTSPQVKSNGTWHVISAANFKEFLSDTAGDVLIQIRIKGLADINKIEAFRFTVGGSVVRGGSPNACKFSPLQLGGNYINSVLAAHRLWDGTLDSGSITYGVRYTNPVTPLYSVISQTTVDQFVAHGHDVLGFDSPLGARMALTVPVETSGSYTFIEFLRLDDDGTTWKVISTVANSGVPQFLDHYEQNEIHALTSAVSPSSTGPGITPAFRTAGIRFMFPYKQSAIWLIQGGEANVEISRVGDAEELYDSSAHYDPLDETQPAQRTLADNQADQPVWGVQAGPHAFIVGEQAAYALQGDIPRDFSPCQQIPGSRGIAGPYAGCRFRPANGDYGAAYCDPDFNIWFLSAVPQFAGDTRARPQELSIMIRSFIKKFLYYDQLAEFPSLAVSDVQVEFEERNSTLWVSLGRRAMCFRHNVNGDGWEPNYYQLTTPPGETTISNCTDYSSYLAVASTVSDSGTPWTLLGFPFASDDSYATSGPLGLGTGKKTDILRMDGFKPAISIPVSATITGVTFRIERSKTGDLQLTETKVQPRKSAVAWGSNLSTSYIVTTSDVATEFLISSGLPTVAEINSGALGIDLQYTQENSHVDWNDPTKWTITVSGGGTSAVMTVTATYIGAGTVPSFVYVNISSLATAQLASGGGITTTQPWYGTGAADDGLGETAAGPLYVAGITPDPALDKKVTASGTHRVRIPLTAGTGTDVVTRSASGTSSSTGVIVQAVYTGSAALSAYVTDTAQVDDVEFKVCSTVTFAVGSLTSGVSMQRVAFSSDNRYLSCRNTGQLDLMEYDFRSGVDIFGNGRDGGYQMPDWFWVSGRLTFESRTAGLRSAQVACLSTEDLVVVESKVDHGDFVLGLAAGMASTRWVKFPLTQNGISHQIRISGDESVVGLDGVAMEFQMISRSKPK